MIYHDNLGGPRSWVQTQLHNYQGCIGFIETATSSGDLGLGTFFHVGDGVCVTARHVIEGRRIREVGFDDLTTNSHLVDVAERQGLLEGFDRAERDFDKDRDFQQAKAARAIKVVQGPAIDPMGGDIAAFRIEPYPHRFLPLGRHIGNRHDLYNIRLQRVLIMGYPPIPLAYRPFLVSTAGEVNSVIQKTTDRDPHFWYPHYVISGTARGGFSGAPVLFPCLDDHAVDGAAVLGVVTEALTSSGQSPEAGYMAAVTIGAVYNCLDCSAMMPPCQGFEDFFAEISGDGNYDFYYDP